MQKCGVTIGEVGGKLVVIDGPSTDIGDLVANLQKLTDDGGKMKSGSKTVTVDNAVLLHSAKGVVKKRKNLTRKAPKAPAED